MMIINGYFPEMFTKKNDSFYEVTSNKQVKTGRVEKMSKSKKMLLTQI